jgi:hypothetical protein
MPRKAQGLAPRPKSSRIIHGHGVCPDPIERLKFLRFFVPSLSTSQFQITSYPMPKIPSTEGCLKGGVGSSHSLPPVASPSPKGDELPFRIFRVISGFLFLQRPSTLQHRPQRTHRLLPRPVHRMRINHSRRKISMTQALDRLRTKISNWFISTPSFPDTQLISEQGFSEEAVTEE